MGKKFEYDYPMAALAVDIVVFALTTTKGWNILLIKRKHAPFEGMFSLPGGFLDVASNETLADAARRELFEETGLKDIPLEQFYTFGDAGRDPRGRTVSVAYTCSINAISTIKELKGMIKAGDDAAHAEWVPMSKLPADLAFDHKKVIQKAVDFNTDKLRLLAYKSMHKGG